MIRVALLFLVLLTSFQGFSQSRFTVNLSAGCDQNINKYYSPPNYLKFENNKDDYNLGVDVGYRLADKFRVRMEFQYGKMSYGHSYGASSDLTKSEMTLTTLAFNPRLDYRIVQFGEFDLYLTTGLRLEYVTDDDQESVRTDGEISTRNYIAMDYDDKLSGMIGGAILKYNFTEHLGLTFSPEYTYFFDQLYSENDGNLQRFSTKVGIEWTF